jgi:hypothetical protein
MAAVTSRTALKDYCLRRLGYPVIEINVSEDQLEDRIDEALEFWREFHSDAVQRIYLKHQVTDSDVANQYITLPPDVSYVTRVFPVSSTWLASTNMFSFQYQFALSDFHQLSSFAGNINYYAQMRQYMNLLDMTFNGQPLVTHVRKANKLYIWGDFNDGNITAGEWVVCEIDQFLDPDTYTPVWNDMYLKELTTALFKRQWGNNLKKFEGMQLPGGVIMNGQNIYDEATAELEEIRTRMRSEFENPIDFYVG